MKVVIIHCKVIYLSFYLPVYAIKMPYKYQRHSNSLLSQIWSSMQVPNRIIFIYDKCHQVGIYSTCFGMLCTGLQPGFQRLATFVHSVCVRLSSYMSVFIAFM